MTTTKRIVCLANSRKMHGRCIAGKELTAEGVGGWIRPVSDREHEEVSERERQYPDGSDPRVLDLIDVPLLEPRPRGHQRENWLINPSLRWNKVGRMSREDLDALVDPVQPLWDVGQEITKRNDKVTLAQAAECDSSLVLLHVDRLHLDVYFDKDGPSGEGKKHLRGYFRHGGMEYRLRVTDPECEKECSDPSVTTYRIRDCYLAISLGEPFKGDCYRLIAAIIRRDGDVGHE